MSDVTYLAGRQINIGADVYFPGMVIPNKRVEEIARLDAFLNTGHVIRKEEGRRLPTMVRRVLKDAQDLGVPQEPAKVKPRAGRVQVDAVPDPNVITAAEVKAANLNRVEGELRAVEIAAAHVEPAAEPAVLAQAATTEFDPSTRTVKEVVEHLKRHPEQLEAVVAREKAGLNRAYADKLMEKRA